MQTPEKFSRDALAFALTALDISQAAYAQSELALADWNMRRFANMNKIANGAAVTAGLVAGAIEPELLPYGRQGTLSLVISEASRLVERTYEAEGAVAHANPEELLASEAAVETISGWETEERNFAVQYKQMAERWMAKTYDLCTVAWKGMNNENLSDEKRLKLARLVRSTSKVGAGIARATGNSAIAKDFVGKGADALGFLKYIKERVAPRAVRKRREPTVKERLEAVMAERALKRAPRERPTVEEMATVPRRKPRKGLPLMQSYAMPREAVEAFVEEEE